MMKFEGSRKLQHRFHSLIPGGAHTYAKGDDQWPEFAAPYIVRGQGCHVWDVDGNQFIEYGMGLRSVTLGHAYKPVVDAAHKQMMLGSNFVRPSTIELTCAEAMLGLIEGAEMVKFAKNGSDVTSAAIRLSRAYTGRELVAICADHPFFSVDDWFIGTTGVSAGIPRLVQSLTVKFRYNDIESIRSLFATYPGRIACLILEPERERPPANNFLQEAQRCCRENGAVFILDEMITGFRWHEGGAQKVHSVVPDLSTFGKAMGNGFAVSALVGKREIMRLGGLHHDHARVFVLSTTHGAEAHSLAAAIETIRTYKEQPVVEVLRQQGERLAQGVNRSILEHGLRDNFEVIGRPCCLLYATRDRERKPSQEFRTLFLQETVKRGLLMPSMIVSYSHSDADIDRTVEAVHDALYVYRRALDEGIEKYLEGSPVRPVYRRFN